MKELVDYPRLVFVVSFLALWLSTLLGAFFLRKRWELREDAREDFGIILATTLTLIGLIIGFTFSMAISRYEQRKNYEAAEANAIGTEYFRIDLLPAADAVSARALLRLYLDQRVSFYTAGAEQSLLQTDARTERLQNELWAVARSGTAMLPAPLTVLVIAGMNDVFNSQAYTQAAWWNRIPMSAWLLMGAIAVIAHLLFGYGAKVPKQELILLTVLPLVVSIAFLLIADIDSPRSGIIRVHPQNLQSLVESLRPH
jgi:hypothetical protein